MTSTIRMHCVVERGEERGQVLEPHRYADGKFVASMTRFETDYVRVDSIRELAILVRHGFSVRMSQPDGGRGPSLISPASIKVTVES